MKNIAYIMLLSVFVVTIGLNTSTYAQGPSARDRWVASEIRREQQEARQNELNRERQRQEQSERDRERWVASEVRREQQEARQNELNRERQRREQSERDRERWVASEVREEQREQQREVQRQQRLRQEQSYGQFNQPNVTGDTRAEDYFGVTLNESERAFYRENRRLGVKVFDIRATASQEAAGRFPNMSLRNTPADAFRHAYASALLARDIGWRGAKYVTDLHETTVGNPPDERDMDLYNNSVGIQIGMTLVRDGYGYRQPTDRELADLTEQALRQGGLVFLQNR